MNDKKKAFAISLAFAIAILIIPSLSSAYAQPGDVKRYRDYSVTELGNNTYTQTLGLPAYVWDGSKFVDRVIQNNGTHFNVYSEFGSFSFNNSTCTITQYTKGFDPTTQTAHDTDIVIKNWFWTIARKNGVNPWSIIDASTLGCNISTFSNSTGKYLTMTRSDNTGSYLKVTLAAPQGQPIEDYAELFMNRTAWSGNKFAFVLWSKDVKADTLTFRNGTIISIPQGQTILDKSQLTVSSMDFIKNGNAFYLDWLKAKTQFKTLILNKTGNNLDVQFGFNDNAVSLSAGQKIFLDPTYGQNPTNTNDRVFGSPNAVTTSCAPATYSGATADNNHSVHMTQSTSNSQCGWAFYQYDTSSLPDKTNSVTNATWRPSVNTVTVTDANTKCDITALFNNTSTMGAKKIYDTIYNISTEYSSSQTWCHTTGFKYVSLSGLSVTNMTTQDYIVLGVRYDPALRLAGGAQNAYWGANPQLVFTYTVSQARYENKPLLADSSALPSSATLYRSNATNVSTTNTNSSGYATFTNTVLNTNYNYTWKDALDNFVINRTNNKSLSTDQSQTGTTQVYNVDCSPGVDTDFRVKLNFTNYHFLTLTTPTCNSDGDISFTAQFLKQGLGPATNQTTKFLTRIIDTSEYTWLPGKLTVNGTTKTGTYLTNVVNFTGIQVGNGYNTIAERFVLYTDNVTSAPQNLRVWKVSNTQYKLDWNAPAANHGAAPYSYRIWRDGVILVNSTGNVLTYTDTVSNGNINKYMVCAWNRMGCSPYSSMVGGPPDKITSVTTNSTAYDRVVVSWTAPSFNSGVLSGYQINYTTPYGTPLTVLLNNSGSSTTSYTVTGLTEQTQYSFRISAWTGFGNNATGTIANITTIQRFIPANFTIGYFNIDSENPLTMPIKFERQDVNSSLTRVNVTYSPHVNLKCDLSYFYAHTNHTYYPISHNTLSTGDYEASFAFVNGTRDQTIIHCWDQNGSNATGRYVMTQSDFLLKQQIRDFRNGTYGTMGILGALDLVTIVVFIFAMIGFNRINPTVGAIFCIIAVFGLAYFEIITIPAVVFTVIGIIVMAIVGTTRKDD